MSWRDDVRRVDWSSFQGAYGPASNIPAELDALCSSSSDVSLSFIHQGDLYEVTPHVVPHLISIAEDEMVDIAARVAVIQLLTAMAETEAPSKPGVRFNPFTKQAESRPYEPFKALVKAIHATEDALKQQRHRVRALAKHPNDEMRIAAKELSSWL
jgi:hypothetical protein